MYIISCDKYLEACTYITRIIIIIDLFWLLADYLFVLYTKTKTADLTGASDSAEYDESHQSAIIAI